MKKSIFILLAAAALLLAGCVTAARPEAEASVLLRPGGPLALVTEHTGPIQVISGIQGERIIPTDVIITFRHHTLREDLAEGSSVDWISNLPRGLSARIREARRGSNRIVILVEGVPQNTLNAHMRFSFPSTVLLGGSFAFESNEAKYEILQGSLNLSENTSPDPAPPSFIFINGSVGLAIEKFDLRVTLVETSLQESIAEETPVNWIENCPEGLSVTVQPARAGATTLYLTVRGTPRQAKNELVQVTIPARILGDVLNFSVPNEVIRWDILGASVEPVLVDGSVSAAIIARDVVIHLMGTSFNADMVPGTTVDWVANMPAGLVARVKRVRSGEHTALITIAGTPGEVSMDVLDISIPAMMVTHNINVPVTANVDARFDINDRLFTISYSEMAGGSSHPNWLGPQRGPLNVPVLPAVKDFQGVGIVTVRTTATERLGADNQYHWTGETVNYGMLIEEAQRLGAHAIINIVVDYTDNIQYSEVIRELPVYHEWSPDELDKISRGILREILRDGIRHSVETSHVITRTYIGSALAIRYIDGLNYLEAERERAQAPRE